MLSKRYLREVPLPEDITHDNIFRALEDTQDFF